MKKFAAFFAGFILVASIFGVVNYSNYSQDSDSGIYHTGNVAKKIVESPEWNKFNSDRKAEADTNVAAAWHSRPIVMPKMVQAHIHTECDGVEKNTSVLYGLLSSLDVDNNPDTGQNGKDVKVRFYILPSVSHEDFGYVLALSVVFDVERLGNELNNKDFKIYLDFHLSLENYDYGTHEFQLGYSSPEGKEIPRNEEVTLTVYPYLMYDRNPDFVLRSTPTFDGGANDVDILARYSGSYGGNTFDHKVVISCQPAISSSIKFTPDMSLQKLSVDISRTAEEDTALTIAYSGETNGNGMDISLAIDKIPREMAFSISYNIFGASGERGVINYDSSNEFNVTLTVSMGRIGLIGNMQLKYLPKHITAGWDNRIYGGYININVSSSSTSFMICNDIDNPTVYFSISNITNSANFSWGMDQGGYIKLNAEKEGPKVNFYWIMGSMRAEVTSQLKTDYLFISWDIDQEGYVTLDTNGNWLNSFSLNFTLDDNVGLLIGASFIKADNFRAEWVIWPPNFQLSGNMDFIGDIVFSVMIGGTWYSLPL